MEKVLLDCGLAYTWVATPDLFLVHPLNKGGTGTNPYSMHKKGATILAAGADMSQLGGSVAFELAVDEVLRKQQLLFNQSMANKASNLLPQPSGKERYLTCSKVMFGLVRFGLFIPCLALQPVLQHCDLVLPENQLVLQLLLL